MPEQRIHAFSVTDQVFDYIFDINGPEGGASTLAALQHGIADMLQFSAFLTNFVGSDLGSHAGHGGGGAASGATGGGARAADPIASTVSLLQRNIELRTRGGLSDWNSIGRRGPFTNNGRIRGIQPTHARLDPEDAGLFQVADMNTWWSFNPVLASILTTAYQDVIQAVGIPAHGLPMLQQITPPAAGGGGAAAGGGGETPLTLETALQDPGRSSSLLIAFLLCIVQHGGNWRVDGMGNNI